VPLRAGGSIVIDGTEALTAIDVNSGGSMRGANPEETAFRTNLEAAAEIARQLRLRDIGGLIVLDFIDMRDARHIQEVERTLRDAMKPDKARHEVGRISRLGLLEISRQRMRPAAMATTYTACPMCEGHGAVRTTESAALVALRKIHNRIALGDVAALRVALPTPVALYLLNQKRDDLARLEQRYDSRLSIDLKDGLMPHQIEMDVRARAQVAQPASVPHGGVAPADTPAAATGNGTAAPSGEPSGKKKRRRRGRRRGTGLRAAAAIGDALAALGSGAGPSLQVTDAASAPAAHTDASAAMPDAHVAHSAVGSRVDDAAPAPPTSVAAGLPLATAPGSSNRSRQRRGRRGGRRRGERAAPPAAAAAGAASSVTPPALTDVRPEPPFAQAPERDVTIANASTPAAPGKKRRRQPRARASRPMAAPAPAQDDTSMAKPTAAGVDSTAPAPRRRRSPAAGDQRRRTRTPATDAARDAKAPAKRSRRKRSP
jgi:ribonuclease E